MNKEIFCCFLVLHTQLKREGWIVLSMEGIHILLSFVLESYYRLLVCNLSVCTNTTNNALYCQQTNKQTNWNVFFQLLAYNSQIGSSTVVNTF